MATVPDVVHDAVGLGVAAHFSSTLGVAHCALKPCRGAGSHAVAEVTSSTLTAELTMRVPLSG